MGLSALLLASPLEMPVALAQAEVRRDGVQLKIRRLPDAIELVLEDVGGGGALEQKRDGKLWLGELRTDRIRGLKSGPQSLAMPDSGMERITFDGTGRLFQLKVTPVKGQDVPAPVVSSDGKNLVLRFDAPVLPVVQTARPNLSTPVPVPTPAFVPPLRPRAVAPPLGDMAVGSMVIRNRAYVNLSGPPVTMTTRGANARDVLMVLAQMGGYGFAYSDMQANQMNGQNTSGQSTRSTTSEPPPVTPVTVAFRNEPYERAFNFVLLTSGLQARREGNTILVGANVLSKSIGAQLSKVYRLNQVGPDQAADYLANLGAQVTKTNTITTASSQGVSQTNSVSNAPAAQTTTSTTTTSVESFGAVTGPLLGLNATTDTRLGTITLFGESALISIAEQYLRQLDLRQRQVALSVKILDVNLSNVSEIDNSFALRFGNNFIVNDQGRLLAAFGRNLPANGEEFSQAQASVTRRNSGSRVDADSTRSTGNESTSTSGSSSGIQRSLQLNVGNDRSLTQQQIEELNLELTRETGTKVVPFQEKIFNDAGEVVAENTVFRVEPIDSRSKSLSNTLANSVTEIVRSTLGSSVQISRAETTNTSEETTGSGRRSRNASRSTFADADRSSEYPFSTRPNPGRNYPDQEFFDFLQAQIISSNTKILASPTLILQEGDGPNGSNPDLRGTDSTRISSDGKIGRERANEAYVRVGTQLVTSYNVKQDINGNNFCEPVFGNAGLTFGARVEKVDDNGFVSFSLSPEISAAVGTQEVGNCGLINLINDRLLDTGRVRVRDGQTLILTGVISSRDQQVVSKWPILGDMPLIGQFFRRTNGDRTKNELVIMVTPRIINDEQGGLYGYGYQPSTRDARTLIYSADRNP
nr:general secretion pathway protein D [Synechococcus sp. HK05]